MQTIFLMNTINISGRKVFKSQCREDTLARGRGVFGGIDWSHLYGQLDISNERRSRKTRLIFSHTHSVSALNSKALYHFHSERFKSNPHCFQDAHFERKVLIKWFPASRVIVSITFQRNTSCRPKGYLYLCRYDCTLFSLSKASTHFRR